MQEIPNPTRDDTETTKILLNAMREGPEHLVHHGLLNAVLAGEANFRGQGEFLCRFFGLFLTLAQSVLYSLLTRDQLISGTVTTANSTTW
jgi:hypothetical protein